MLYFVKALSFYTSTKNWENIFDRLDRYLKEFMMRGCMYKIFFGLILLAESLFSLEEALISFTFDDGYACQYETVIPLLEKYDFSSTFYFTNDFLDKPGYVTSKEVIEIFRKGHEIGSHSLTHKNLKQISRSQVKKELMESKLLLEILIAGSVVSFAPPFGVYGRDAFFFLKNTYSSSRSIVPGLNRIKNINPFFIYGNVIFSSTSLIEIEALIRKTIKEKAWLVLVYHRVDERDHMLSVSPKKFEQTLKLVQDFGLRVLPVKEALSQYFEVYLDPNL